MRSWLRSLRVVRRLRTWWSGWRTKRVGERVVARKIITFSSPEEMDAALRRFDRGDISGMLK